MLGEDENARECLLSVDHFSVRGEEINVWLDPQSNFPPTQN